MTKLVAVLHITLTLILGVALIVSLKAWSNARKELQTVVHANNFLRQTLGDMTVMITGKDKEIDRLSQFTCDCLDKPANVPKAEQKGGEARIAAR
jgi:hypothetical protein